MALMVELRTMTGAATRLLVTRHVGGASIGEMVAEYRPAVVDCMDRLRAGGSGAQVLTQLLEARAQIIAAFELVNLARACAFPLSEVAGALGELAEQLDLDWLGAAINRLPAGNRWQARARAQLSAELTGLRQHLLQQVLNGSLPPTDQADAVIDELKSNVPQDLAMLSAGLAEARRLLAS
jgi:NAD-specific glutamate dehydrogenase